MRRKAVGQWLAISVGAGILAGCGGPRGPEPISHGMTAGQVQAEILARVRNWHVVSEHVTLSLTENGMRQAYSANLTDQVNPPLFSMQVTPVTGPPYDVVDNGLNTVLYQPGSSRYAIEPVSPMPWRWFQLAAGDFPQMLASSRAVGVTVKPKVAVLTLNTPIAPNIQARTEVWFNLDTNTPMRWESAWSGNSLTLVPSHVEVNPSGGIGGFTPPTGVTPMVMPSGAADGYLPPPGPVVLRDAVNFPLVLPPAGMPLALNAIQTDANTSPETLVLTYMTPNGTPVVITESRRTGFTPPPGVPVITENVGALTVMTGVLPEGVNLAALTLGHTLVVVEGPQNVVENLLTAWANSVTASPSTTGG